jgi:hypothetical protein
LILRVSRGRKQKRLDRGRTLLNNDIQDRTMVRWMETVKKLFERGKVSKEEYLQSSSPWKAACCGCNKKSAE